MIPFYTPWNQQNMFDFLVFQGVWNGDIDQKWVKKTIVFNKCNLISYNSPN